MDESKQRKSNVNLMLVFVILLLLVVCCGFGWYIYSQSHKDEGRSQYDQQVDKITEIDYEDRQAALNEIVEENQINVYYWHNAIFVGKTSASFKVRNIENNHHPMVFTIFGPDGETVLYDSEPIEPGYELNAIELTEELPLGTHDCTIQVSYDGEGNVASVFPITIEVREE